MKVVLVPVLPILVIVQPGHDDRTTGTATGGRREGVEKHHPIGSQGVHVWRDGRRIPVTTQRGAFIVCDEKNDVLLSPGEGRAKKAAGGYPK